MKASTKKKLTGILALLIVIFLVWYTRDGGDGEGAHYAATVSTAAEDAAPLDENGTYSEKDELALYISTYGHLPDNFVTKDEARKEGWSGGSLEDYFPGCSIGGDEFGNREGLLPDKNGRQYYECDVDTMGASERGAKRIVYSNDGLVYYTDDHYESFTLLYGEE